MEVSCMKNATFKSVKFDDENKQLTILLGTPKVIKYDDIQKVSVINEDAKFRGKSEPFSHQVLGGTTFYTFFGGPELYVGLKILLKDKTICAVYISDRKTSINTDIYQEDGKEAAAIKKMIEKRIS